MIAVFGLSSACSSGGLPEGFVEFTTTTYADGPELVLENNSGTHTSRIAVDTRWGGTIVEVSLDGKNLVNRHDTGRNVGPAFYDGNAKYDGCAGCQGVFGWDPVLGGDKYGHGTPILESRLDARALYVKAQPLEWNPDDKGGGPDTPVLGDLLVEETVTPVGGAEDAFHVHYAITHLGSDDHANIQQEIPAVYVDANRPYAVSYTGTVPWRNDDLDPPRLLTAGSLTSTLYTPERWTSFVDADGIGLTAYAPASDPYTITIALPGPGGPAGSGASYFAPVSVLSIRALSHVETDTFLVAGEYHAARRTIYTIHSLLEQHDVLPPIGAVQTPLRGSTVSKTVAVDGWAFDAVAVAEVTVSVDGTQAGVAAYHLPKPTVGIFYPNAPTDIGFSYYLDTTRYANGSHVIGVRATDQAGNVAVLRDTPVTIANTP